MIICRCNEVTLHEIKQFISKKPYATFDELKLATTASTACGRCHSLLKKTNDKINKDLPSNKQLRISF
jgi:bacterioferritin-associated ferredoxin